MNVFRAVGVILWAAVLAAGCCYSFPGTDPTTPERAFTMMQYAVARGAQLPPPVDYPDLAGRHPFDVMYSLLAYPFRDHYGYFRIRTLGWKKVVENADALLNMRFDRALKPNEIPRPLDWREGVVAPLKNGVVVRVRLLKKGRGNNQVYDYVQLVKETAREEDRADSTAGERSRYHIVEYQPHSRTWRRIVTNIREGTSNQQGDDDDWFDEAGEERGDEPAKSAKSPKSSKSADSPTPPNDGSKEQDAPRNGGSK